MDADTPHPPIPPVVDLSPRMTQVRSLLSALSAVPDLDLMVTLNLLSAAGAVEDTPSPPPPMPPQPASSDVRRDLALVLELLAAESAQAPTAAEIIRLALVMRDLRDAQAGLGGGEQAPA